MKKPLPILILFIQFSLLFSACQRDIKDEIVGTWEAVDVSPVKKEGSLIDKGVLDQTLAYYRTVNFEFFEDYTLNIVSSGNSYPGIWKYTQEDQSIFIRMDQEKTEEYTKLGVFTEDTIVSTNKTEMGTMVVKYVKSSDYN